MDSTNRPHRRRQYLINRDFQIGFILKFCLLLLLAAAVSTVILVWLSHGTLTSAFIDSRLVVRSTSMALLPKIIITHVITVLFMAAATILVVLFVSHKIAGPLYRVTADLKAIAAGDLARRVRFRKKDQLAGLADAVNEMTAAHHAAITAIQASLADTLHTAEDAGAPAVVADKLRQSLQLVDNHFTL